MICACLVPARMATSFGASVSSGAGSGFNFTFRALATALAIDASEPVAQVNATERESGPGNGVPLPDESAPPPGDASTISDATPTQHHRVRRGETLWSIAHRYHVSVGDLKRWNGLHGNTLRAGKELRIGD